MLNYRTHMPIRYLPPFLRDWFLGGILLTVLIASFFPTIGMSGGLLKLDKLVNAGIFCIFLLHGIGLSTEQLMSGILRWRLHLFIQCFTFIIFPLLYLLFRPLWSYWMPSTLMLGFFFLCALPSTISSSVAMTSSARGNVAGAIFNATLSGLLGIFITPLLINWATAGSQHALSFNEAVIKLSTLLLLPLLLGQLLRPLIGKWLQRYKSIINMLDKSIILMLVLNAFSDSVSAGLWTNYGAATLLSTALSAAVLLITVLCLTRYTARYFGFNVEDEIAAVFCGSKKTLASGIPMAKLLFGANPSLGLIVLPLMFYHQLQLLVCAVIAERYRKRQ